MKSKYFFLGALFSFCLVLCLAQPSLSFLWNSSNPHLLLGNPSNAVSSLKTPNNYLLTKPQYVLSYNRSKSIPNWVSWQLNKTWLGKYKRCQGSSNSDRFLMDQDLPIAITPVLPTDYRGSGFDRGHIIPAGDRTKSYQDNCSTFVMTNIIPQTRDINRGPWETLENYSRRLARKDKELYIIAGGAGIGGENGQGENISSFTGYDSGLEITVPAFCWKIIVVLDRPNLGLAGITSDSRVIAVIMKQQMGTKKDLWNIKQENGSFRYITSVREVEKLTGYDFLSNLPKTLQDSLETKIDSGD